MTHLTLSQLANKKAIPASADKLVVGVGMSGLYATWRILQKDPKASILIFERFHRTGGLLHIGSLYCLAVLLLGNKTMLFHIPTWVYGLFDIGYL